ncbi:hypothetical protein PENTCL1PPCAC_24562, partial [Pristionchus entomophagus]
MRGLLSLCRDRRALQENEETGLGEVSLEILDGVILLLDRTHHEEIEAGPESVRNHPVPGRLVDLEESNCSSKRRSVHEQHVAREAIEVLLLDEGNARGNEGNVGTVESESETSIVVVETSSVLVAEVAGVSNRRHTQHVNDGRDLDDVGRDPLGLAELLKSL